jgi:hypothetical protein
LSPAAMAALQQGETVGTVNFRTFFYAFEASWDLAE